MNDKIKVVAFDADDTLWENQAYYDAVEEKFCKLMSCYGDDSFLRQELFNTEMQNMETLGYGAMAFTLSMIETALRLSDGAISGTEIRELYGNGKNLLENPATPFPGVEETLETITSTRPYKMIVITKGNTADQQNKMRTRGSMKSQKSSTIPIFSESPASRNLQTFCNRPCQAKVPEENV